MSQSDTRPPYRDSATVSAVVAIMRMGTDPGYRDVAEARFGRMPRSYEMEEAIAQVRRDGVRREEA